MESIINTAASYVGYGQSDKEVAGNQLGEALSSNRGETQGVEPVSGKTGSGTAGQPYDAGNSIDSSNIDGFGTADTNTAGYGAVDGTHHGSSGHQSGSMTTAGTNVSGVSRSSDTTGLGTSGTSTYPQQDYSSGGSSSRNQATSSSYGQTGAGESSHHASTLGSSRGYDKTGDGYSFNSHNAPGSGGHRAHHADDFTDANIHHQGSGHRITSELGSDENSGKSTGSGVGNSGTGIQDASERTRKPGYGRDSYAGTGSSGLIAGGNSKPRETTTQKVEQKIEQRTPATSGSTTQSTQNSGVNDATSGVYAMNLNDKERVNDGAYDVTNAGGYTSGTQQTSTGSNGGAGILEERIAGPPRPNSDEEECEAGHHNSHPSGENAHQDGSHKPTFLNYRHDDLGVPTAKGT